MLGVLYIGIGQYGSFVSGLQIIQNQVHSVGDYLGRRASAPFQFHNPKPKVRKRGESLTRLQNLFVKVQHSKITVDEAMRESEVIFGSEVESAPDFMAELKKSLEQTPLLRQQIKLPLENTMEEGLILATKKQRKPRSTKPREPVPDSEQFQIKVWREKCKLLVYSICYPNK